MVSTEATVDVGVETYSNAVPDWFEGDTIPVETTAFSDKVYLDFPAFYRVERNARRTYLEPDTMLHGDGEKYPVDRSEITDLETALEYLLWDEDNWREHVPEHTTQMCMSAMNVFTALVQVNDRGDLSVEPALKKMNVLREQEGSVVLDDDVSRVVTTILGDKSNNAYAHLKLVEEFATTIAGIQDDDYWLGYKRAANRFGDNKYTWADVAWDCFEDEWNGNQELMLDVGKWLADEGWAVCSRTKALFPVPEWSAPTGSYVANMSDIHDGTCPKCGADKDENWECIKSSNRTRVPNKYRCNNCGTTKNGITTG